MGILTPTMEESNEEENENEMKTGIIQTAKDNNNTLMGSHQDLW